MTKTAAIDTFEFIKELGNAGIKEEGARIIAKKLVEIQTQNFPITREDLARERDDIGKDIKTIARDLSCKIEVTNKDIKTVHDNLDAKIDAVENKIVIRLTKNIVIGLGICTTLLSLLITNHH